MILCFRVVLIGLWLLAWAALAICSCYSAARVSGLAGVLAFSAMTCSSFMYLFSALDSAAWLRNLQFQPALLSPPLICLRQYSAANRFYHFAFNLESAAFEAEWFQRLA